MTFCNSSGATTLMDKYSKKGIYISYFIPINQTLIRLCKFTLRARYENKLEYLQTQARNISFINT